MKTVIVNTIHLRNFQRRLFCAQVEETEHTQLLLHTDVQWLSRGKFLARFCELLPEVKELLRQSKDAVYTQLDDEQWLMDLAVLTDLPGILNELNLE